MSKPPTLTPMKSSMLNGQSYDPATGRLIVEFKNGTRYAYDGVPADKYEAFSGAASPGSFFAAKIRNNHTATKL